MAWTLAYPSISLCYGFLYLSVILLWFPGKRKLPNWTLSLILALLLGWYSSQLDWSALVSILIFALATYYSLARKTNTWWRLVATVIVLILSLGLISHQLPGFNGLRVFDHVYFSSSALPYNLYLNVDKTVMGIFILGFGPPLLASKKSAFLLFKEILPKTLLLALLVLALALLLGCLRFDPKLPSTIFLWALTNLLFICVPEEALFRGFIQRKLGFTLADLKGGTYVALFLASFLFGLAHYADGKKYILLAMVAGLGYGWIYKLTHRIEASIMAHFSLNLIHFLLFTYPALASTV